MTSNPNILIIRTDFLGDNIYGLPVADDLKAAIPGCRITWVARASVAGLLRMDRNIDEVLAFDSELDPEWLLPQIKGRFDASVILWPKPKNWLPLAAALRKVGIPVRVGSGRRWWGLFLYTHRMWESRHRGQGIHECQRSREHGRVLMKALGGDPAVCDRMPPQTGLVVPPAEMASVAAWYRERGIRRPVILHLGANTASAWPVECFAQLADHLSGEGVPVLISTGFRRPDLESEMKRFCKLEHVFTPHEPTLETLASWLGSAACVVAASTGPLHLAAMLGTPTVGLFPCIKDCLPDRWGALGPKSLNLVAPPPEGGMYRHRSHADPDHLRAIKVDTVLDAVRTQLGV